MGGRHVCALAHCDAAIFHKLTCILSGEFILRGAGQGDITRYSPNLPVFRIFCAGALGNIFADSAAAAFLNILDHLKVDPFRVINATVRIARCNNLRTQLLRFSIA